MGRGDQHGWRDPDPPPRHPVGPPRQPRRAAARRYPPAPSHALPQRATEAGSQLARSRRDTCGVADADRDVSVGVVGGGLGGLTAALALLRAGFDVHVYEQASTLHEVGAGIQVSPNASRVLHGLGLADDLARTGVRPRAWHQRRWDDGRTLLRTPL